MPSGHFHDALSDLGRSAHVLVAPAKGDPPAVTSVTQPIDLGAHKMVERGTGGAGE